MRARARFILLFAAILAACTPNYGPVDIEAGDMCAFCKMDISERRFAAEMIAEDEVVLKFDDVGCLLNYRKRDAGKTAFAAVYLTDHDTKTWLKAEDAFLVRSETIKTPMGSSIVAYASAEKAGPGYLRFSQLEEE